MAGDSSPWIASEAPRDNDKRHAPATLRNRDAIAQVLRTCLPAGGRVLEIASGSGEHIVHFAEVFPALEWQPSDPDPAALLSIAAWTAEAGPPNILDPVRLDARSDDWPVEKAAAILCINMKSNSCEGAKSVSYAACLCINMVHISEWAATVGLFKGCSKVLQPGAPLILYGPYLEDDVETAPSNLVFDCSLKDRNPEWGLRNVADVDSVAAKHGFKRIRRVGMPANNLTLIYRKG